MRSSSYLLRETEPELVERVRWLRRHLLNWFRQSGRSFPWREPNRAPYEIVVSEILLQRTMASSVARAYPAFIERYPSWAALASSSPEDLRAGLRPLGLWRQKARALRNLALFFEGCAGVIPDSRLALEHLPGIGPYTASTALAIVHGRAEPFVDVNMVRLLRRFFGLPAGTASGVKRSLHALGLRLVKGKHSLQVNWAVLDFAALVCRARRPLCLQCPLRDGCRYREQTPDQPPPTPGARSGSMPALMTNEGVVDQFNAEDATAVGMSLLKENGTGL
jgi:A/G-specific adenine glycosylase